MQLEQKNPKQSLERTPLGLPVCMGMPCMVSLSSSRWAITIMRALLPIFLPVGSIAHADPIEVQQITRTTNGYDFRAYVLPIDAEGRIVIREFCPRQIAEFSLLSKDGHQGGHIEHIEWSKDAQYLVFSTSSSGGHSAWHYPTYVFSSRRNEFLSLDDAIAPVTSGDFLFSDPNHLKIQTRKTSSSFNDATEDRVVDLNSLPWKKPKTEQDTEANP